MRVDNLRHCHHRHVDHGKTTMFDKLLRATDAFRANQEVEDRVLDSNDQERERGITILAKNISIDYKDVKINVIDTPGRRLWRRGRARAAYGRFGALLLVDALRAPCPRPASCCVTPSTPAFRSRSSSTRSTARAPTPRRRTTTASTLWPTLAPLTTSSSSPWSTWSASAMNGFARLDPNDGNMDMYPLLDMIIATTCPLPRLTRTPAGHAVRDH